MTHVNNPLRRETFMFEEMCKSMYPPPASKQSVECFATVDQAGFAILVIVMTYLLLAVASVVNFAVRTRIVSNDIGSAGLDRIDHMDHTLCRLIDCDNNLQTHVQDLMLKHDKVHADHEDKFRCMNRKIDQVHALLATFDKEEIKKMNDMITMMWVTMKNYLNEKPACPESESNNPLFVSR